jgi:hypothetical protein
MKSPPHFLQFAYRTERLANFRYYVVHDASTARFRIAAVKSQSLQTALPGSIIGERIAELLAEIFAQAQGQMTMSLSWAVLHVKGLSKLVVTGQLGLLLPPGIFLALYASRKCAHALN